MGIVDRDPAGVRTASADNELIALRANGVSVTRVSVPLAGIAIGCTAICLWLNVQAAPAAQERLRSTIFDLATRNPMALFVQRSGHRSVSRPQDLCRQKGREQTRKHYRVRDEREGAARVDHVSAHRYARSGFGEQTNPDAPVWSAVSGARLEKPFNLHKIHDGINMVEGTLPISLEELYDKEKKRPSRSALSIEQLLETQERKHTGTQRQPHGNQ